MSTRLKLAFSTRPAQQWIDVAFGSPRRWGGGELSGGSSPACVARRRHLIRTMEIPLNLWSRDAGRSRWGCGMGATVYFRQKISPRGSRCVRACSNARCAHGSGRLINAAGSIRSARARVSSTRGLTCCRVGSRPKATDRRASNALRGSRSTRAAREARPTYSIFQRKPIGSSRSARYGRAP